LVLAFYSVLEHFGISVSDPFLVFLGKKCPKNAKKELRKTD
jgi:hypothetical protein